MHGIFTGYKRFVLFSAIVFVVFNCKEESIYPYLEKDFHACYADENWDSLRISNFLVGKWIWKFRFCELGASNSVHTDLSIEFISDSTLIFKTDKEIDTLFWSLYRDTHVNYKLSTNKLKSQLHGLIYICEDVLIFNAGSWDGCANYYERADSY